MTRLIASGDLDRARWTSRIQVRLHLWMCRHCRRYEEQMRAIGQAARGLFRSGEEDAAARERLERAILRPDRGSGPPKEN